MTIVRSVTSAMIMTGAISSWSAIALPMTFLITKVSCMASITSISVAVTGAVGSGSTVALTRAVGSRTALTRKLASFFGTKACEAVFATLASSDAIQDAPTKTILTRVFSI